MPPGSVMLITDHINFSGTNPLIGEPSDRRFVGLTEAYDAACARPLERRGEATRASALHEGVYMWFSGPCFETPAEIRMARILGADAVGMSTVPEVILARFFGLRVAACSVITNFAAGMTGAELSHQETKDMAPIGGAELATILPLSSATACRETGRDAAAGNHPPQARRRELSAAEIAAFIARPDRRRASARARSPPSPWRSSSAA